MNPLHLLAALLGEKEGVVRAAAGKDRANRRQLEQIVQSELGHFPKVSGGAPPQVGQELNQVLEAAQPKPTR